MTTATTEKDRLRAEVRTLRKHADEMAWAAEALEHICDATLPANQLRNDRRALSAAVRAYLKSERDR